MPTMNEYREASLILPLHVPGSTEAANHAETMLLDSFGGFTVHSARGAWRDASGRPVLDAVAVYTVAVPRVIPAADASGIVSHESERAWMYAETILLTLARDVARMAGQDCVYVKLPRGQVLLIGQDGRDVRGMRNAPYPLA